MNKQKFVQGAWRRAGGSRTVRFALMLIAAAAVGVAAGRALSARGDSPQAGAAGSPQVGAPGGALPAAQAPGAGSPSQPKGSVVEAQVPLPTPSNPNPGYISDVPNVDFSGLSPAQKEEAVKILNERRCTCNCNMTLAQCRRDDRSCPRSPVIVARFLDLVRKGTPPAQAADKMYADGAAPAAQPAAGVQPAPSGKLVVYKVEAGEAPAVGPRDAPVTIIEFLDFQCPFCARGNETVERILSEYPGKVRVVYKQHALAAIHPQATLASEAALAANEQGKYHEMHRKLFTIQRELGRDRILAAAGEVGLNVATLTAALDSGKHRAAVDADTKQAEALGATGTPAFFINGRYLSGARPFEQFKQIIDEELAGKRPPFEYGTNVRGETARTQAAAQAAQRKAEEEDVKKVYTADLKGRPSTGSAKAPITIVEFTDFQCPFCKRVQPTLKQVLQDYKGKVRLVTKNLPLPFHQNARPMARAALAAQEQGKYWEFRDRLFDNPGVAGGQTLEETLVGHARSLGLNLDKFRADMASPEIEQRITADQKEAEQIGASGTPTFLINGHKLVGAQPLEAFKQRIDAELSGKSQGAAGGR